SRGPAGRLLRRQRFTIGTKLSVGTWAEVLAAVAFEHLGIGLVVAIRLNCRYFFELIRTADGIGVGSIRRRPRKLSSGGELLLIAKRDIERDVFGNRWRQAERFGRLVWQRFHRG